jgi:hypothetical protein
LIVFGSGKNIPTPTYSSGQFTGGTPEQQLMP